MKFLILFLISFQVMASEYNCVARNFKLKLALDKDFTTLLIQDRQTQEFLWNGVIDQWSEDGNFSKLGFDTHHSQDLVLTFKAEDLSGSETHLYGFIDGWTGRGFVNSSLHCILN